MISIYSLYRLNLPLTCL